MNAKNITKGDDNLLKQKKIFSDNRNMFVGQKYCLQGNKDLLKNNQRLIGIWKR